MIPRATYRIQFHKGFTFADAGRLAGYFDRLGISHLYASPILTARPGSMHGYDVIDHSRINPELGGEEGFREMATRLRERDIGIIVDIVPNHMAVGGSANAWWLDVLEKGRESAYAAYFDIDWEAPGLEGKILAPFLGVPFEEAVQSGDLKLARDLPTGKLAFAYYDHRFPLRPEDQAAGATDLLALDLHDLHRRQNFVLADWREADARINWRRFFDITELAALNAGRDEVFEATHAKIFALHAEGLLDGVRVDHVDGLSDPRAYCRKLRARLDGLGQGSAYIVVEKILASDEALPLDWEVDGTTGYDFMNEVSALQHGPDKAGVLDELWRRYGNRTVDFETEERQARFEIIATKFSSQLAAAGRAFARKPAYTTALGGGLETVIAELRCYRTYATGRPDSPDPGFHIDQALAKAALGNPAVEFVGDTLRDKTGDENHVEAIRRFNQLSAPVAAKAVEDTAFYRYGRLLSRNDVGFDPRQRSLDLCEFHERMAYRARAWPKGMLATATHDHKRGEDARARLAVLSEVPDLWQERARQWFALKASRGIDGADEYQLYQTLVGVWPVGGTSSADFEGLASRVEGWCVKYLREAKLRSNWLSPDEAYEVRMRDFARGLLQDALGAEFRGAMDEFVAHIAPAARANSLVQCGLRCTVPGVPDLYQGCEFWDFSLVDPDNRRPVDFASRERMDAGQEKQALIAGLLQLRKQHPDLFRCGSYRALAVTGPRQDNVIAFERRHGKACLWVVALCLGAPALCGTTGLTPPSPWWKGSTVELPQGLPEQTGNEGELAMLLKSQPFHAALFETP